jgi:hypothetical protein
MSDNDFQKYEDLKNIEDAVFITTLQQIKSDISNQFSPLPNRITSINLLRSMCKYHTTYFYNFFWGIKKDFINNCLNYENSSKLQQMSFFFLNEILTIINYEIPQEYTNQFIFWLYENTFGFLTKSNNILKESAKNLIRSISDKIPCEAVGICLLKSLQVNDENIINFISQCLNLYFNEYLSYGLNFNYIIEKLEIDKVCMDKENQNYYLRIKNIFKSFKSMLENEGNDMNLITDFLDNKNKAIFFDLIK